MVACCETIVNPGNSALSSGRETVVSPYMEPSDRYAFMIHPGRALADQPNKLRSGERFLPLLDLPLQGESRCSEPLCAYLTLVHIRASPSRPVCPSGPPMVFQRGA